MSTNEISYKYISQMFINNLSAKGILYRISTLVILKGEGVMKVTKINTTMEKISKIRTKKKKKTQRNKQKK